MQKKIKQFILFCLIISIFACTNAFSEAAIIDNRYKVDVHVSETQLELTKAIKDLGAGETFTFGKYEQDNVLSNGKEPIEWIVLGKNSVEKYAILISKHILDCLRFNGFMENVTWCNCSLRQYMNNTMIYDMFTEEEIKCIKDAYVEANPNPYYMIPSGDPTYDKLYIPSIHDMYNFFSNPTYDSSGKWYELLKPNFLRAAKATPYAIARGVRALGSSRKLPQNANYFLRTIGVPGTRVWYRDVYADFFQSFVTEFGEIKPDGTGINSTDDGVRVMMQVYY